MSDVIPTLIYRDANRAIEFLKSAFGAEEHAVHRGDDGSVAHAELRLGDGLVMLGDHDPAGRLPREPGSGSVYVVRAEVDEHFARARAAGAEVVMEPTDQSYGSRDYIVRDPEGVLWCFGTYRPA